MPITSSDDTTRHYPPRRPSRVERWKQRALSLGVALEWRPPGGAHTLLLPQHEHEWEEAKACIAAHKAAMQQIERGEEPTLLGKEEFHIPESHFRPEAIALGPWFTGDEHEEHPIPVALACPTPPRGQQEGGHQLNVEWLLKHAEGDADPDIAHELAGGIELESDIEFGISLAFHHPCFWKEAAMREKSLSALKEEAEAGCFVQRGVIPMVPLRCNPRFIVEQGVKADGVTRKLRAIVNLSWRLQSEGASVNDMIDLLEKLHDLKLTSGVRFGRDVGILAEIAAAVVLIKRDMANAFRQVPICPLDWWMQCCISGRGVEVDTRMVMGARSSVHKFQRIHEALVRIYRRALDAFDGAHPPRGDKQLVRHLESRVKSLGEKLGSRTSTTHPYVDDACHATSNDLTAVKVKVVSFEVGSVVERGRVHEAIIDATYADFNVKMAGGDKAEYKYEEMEALGIEVDVVAKVLRYPPRKKPALKSAIGEVLAVPKGGTIKRKKVERLVGREKWLTHVALELDHLLSSAYATAHAKPAHVGVGDRLRDDQLAILTALDDLPDVPLVPASAFPTMEAANSLVVFQDASTSTGYGGWFVWESVFYYAFGAWEAGVHEAFREGEWSISPAEAWAELLMLELAAEVAAGARAVTDYTDNESTRAAARKGRSRSDAMRPIAERIAALSGVRGRVTRTLRVSTSENHLADALSRGDTAAAEAAARELGIPARRLYPSAELLALLPRRGA